VSSCDTQGPSNEKARIYMLMVSSAKFLEL